MKRIAFLIASTFFGNCAAAKYFYILEFASTVQTQNDQRIPGKGGTDFSFTEFGKGPFASYRIYLGNRWERHELRALYAPFSIRESARLKKTTVFDDSVFQAGVETEGYYQFNSYRLTYSYGLEKGGDWDIRWGFTAKIRDAEVTLSQGSLVAAKSNLGFVPLINFQASRSLSDNFLFRFDVDALAAPQGRAIDLALFIERPVTNSQFVLFGGYRTVEGGADNDKVFNYAWIHSLTLGLRGDI